MALTRLRKRLLLDPLPQYRVASQCGFSPTTLSDYALGRKDILPKHLIALSRYFRCDPNELLGYLDEPDILDILEEGTTTPHVFSTPSR